MAEDTKRLSLGAVTELTHRALSSNGFSEKQAASIARTITAAERDGCTSHGLFRVPFYIKALNNPVIDARAVPKVSSDASAVVHVDAKGGFCPLALEMGLGVLESKAKEHGIAALAIHQACNIAALWPEVEALCDRGLVAFAFTASNACVAPAGGTEPVYGTNPMAFGWPRDGRPPMVFDQASSACARGEIQLHKRAGKPLQEGWAIDVDGQPTTDPDAALAGAQLPFGGHKGAALALMIELLAGALLGDLFSYESSAQDEHKTGAPFGGEFLIAIDPARCAPGTDRTTQNARAEALFARVLEQDGTRLPSDRRYKARERTCEEGVDVAVAVIEQIEALVVG